MGDNESLLTYEIVKTFSFIMQKLQHLEYDDLMGCFEAAQRSGMVARRKAGEARRGEDGATQSRA